MAETKQSKDPNEMSFLDHLEELRWHLIRSIVVIVGLACVAFFFKGFIFDTILFGPKKMDFPTYQFFCSVAQFIGIESDFCAAELPFTIQNRTMAGQFSAHIWTSIWAGFIVGFPFVLWELWRLYQPRTLRKRKAVLQRFHFCCITSFFHGAYYLDTISCRRYP